MALIRDEAKKIRDLAIRIWLLEWHDEWATCSGVTKDWCFEPLQDAIPRIANWFGSETEHYGDCINQPVTCSVCVKEEYEEKARRWIKEDRCNVFGEE